MEQPQVVTAQANNKTKGWPALVYSCSMEQKTDFHGMYREAHNNAVRFLREAEALFEKENFARSYFLAFTGLEEIAKSQLAADVVTGYIEEKVFWEYFKSHNKKIGRVVWASLDAEEYLDLEQEIFRNRPSYNRRTNERAICSLRPGESCCAEGSLHRGQGQSNNSHP
jgi:AbiV family abortive infection protein